MICSHLDFVLEVPFFCSYFSLTFSFIFFSFFFFQAEDGIRDVAVTGVQTCALPILAAGLLALRSLDATTLQVGVTLGVFATLAVRGLRPATPHRPGWWAAPATGFASRSEEHTSELQSRLHLVCRLLLEKKKTRRHRS